jgi:hypothetical protein
MIRIYYVDELFITFILRVVEKSPNSRLKPRVEPILEVSYTLNILQKMDNVQHNIRTINQ